MHDINDDQDQTDADQVNIGQPIDSTEVDHDETSPELNSATSSDDENTDEAIDDITTKEGDEVLAAEDAEVAKAFEPPIKTGFRHKIKVFLQDLWADKRKRWATIVGLVVIVLALITIPMSRYFFLNLAGVRSSASLTVLDNSTQLPLKNVQVSLAGQTSKTNDSGLVKLTHLRLGRAQLSINKPAFATQKQTVTVGWGSNPLGSFPVQPVGAQYTFVIKDWLSGQPIQKAEASSGSADAQSDKNGKIVLTVESGGNATTLPVTITADTYRNQQLQLDLTTKTAQTVNMVPARKEVFISNRSGKDDVYKVDVDGKNEQLVLAGTGNEVPASLALVPHLTDEVAALVSTRDNVHDSDGFLLSTLTLIDLSDDSTISVAQSEQIQIVGWVGSQLVYVQIAAGASAANPKRFQLIAYDYKTGDKTALDSANSFNDVLLASDAIYYAPSSTSDNDPNTGLYKIDADGSNKRTLLSQEVWNIFRVSYDSFDLSLLQTWYHYNLGDVLPTKLTTAPASPVNRLYIDSPDGKHSLWVDQRDGKGVLIDYDTTKKTDATLVSQGGLSYPVRWLTNSTLVYRIHTDQETADYALNINGGQPRKISDVFNAAGLNLWYYY